MRAREKEKEVVCMLQENLASALNKILQERNMSRVELCNILNMPSSTVYPILQGQGNPQISTVEKIARRLHVRAIDLVTDFHSEEAQEEALSAMLKMTVDLPEEQQHSVAVILKKFLELFSEEP